MRQVFRALALVVLLAASLPARAADQPAHIKGLWLTTDYPALTARVGETTNVKMKLQNYDLPPQRVALSVSGVPQGWKAIVLGGGAPVEAAMPGTNDNVQLTLRLDIPAGAAAGTQRLTVDAKGAEGSVSLPLDVTIGQDLPAQLTLKPKLPSLRGTAKSSFEFQFSVKNEGDKDETVQLAAAAPPGFQATFTEAYGSQEISSIPIEAGQSKDLKVKVTPPATAPANDYPVAVRVSAEGVQATSTMTMQIIGQPDLKLSGENGRLSAEANAGAGTPITLVVSNDGGAPAQGIDFSSSPPTDWKVSFQPDKIDELAPGQTRNVQAVVTPSAKALAGDYMTTIRANAQGSSSSADFRISVATSTLWGIVGVGIVAIALLIAVGAVARFGRR